MLIFLVVMAPLFAFITNRLHISMYSRLYFGQCECSLCLFLQCNVLHNIHCVYRDSPVWKNLLEISVGCENLTFVRIWFGSLWSLRIIFFLFARSNSFKMIAFENHNFIVIKSGHIAWTCSISPKWLFRCYFNERIESTSFSQMFHARTI